jgi:hypothetical protein
MDHLIKAVKTMSREGLEAAFADAMQRAKDGREINNERYAARQETIAKILSDEILERILS